MNNGRESGSYVASMTACALRATQPARCLQKQAVTSLYCSGSRRSRDSRWRVGSPPRLAGLPYVFAHGDVASACAFDADYGQCEVIESSGVFAWAEQHQRVAGKLGRICRHVVIVCSAAGSHMR